MDQNEIGEFKDSIMLRSYSILLAAKFRLDITADENSFISEMRRIVMEFDASCPVSDDLFREFKNLFNHYDKGIIWQYKLPTEEFFITEEKSKQIYEEAMADESLNDGGTL